MPIYELGTLATLADARPYFTMKLVKGSTLWALLAARADAGVDLPRLLAIFEAMVQTMAYAHTRGVIHRDLKPSNVMVGAFGEVQVMDWGLAKVLPRGGVEDDTKAGKVPEQTVIATAHERDADRSRAGSVLGTPSYMAPEQARGETDQLDERCDVFALGSMLCEVLTSAPAFTGRSSGEIVRKSARGETAEALGRLNACGADDELIELARDSLSGEREDRPRDAGVVAGRVSAYLAGVRERAAAERERAAAERERAAAERERAAAERERAVAQVRAEEELRQRHWQLGLAATMAASLLLGTLGLAAFATIVRQKNDRLTALGLD